MKGLLLLSVVLLSFVIPAVAARHPDPRRGLVHLLVATFVVNALYLAYLTLVHPVVYVPHWP